MSSSLHGQVFGRVWMCWLHRRIIQEKLRLCPCAALPQRWVLCQGTCAIWPQRHGCNSAGSYSYIVPKQCCSRLWACNIWTLISLKSNYGNSNSIMQHEEDTILPNFKKNENILTFQLSCNLQPFLYWIVTIKLCR